MATADSLQAAWEGELFRLLVENTKDYAIFVIDLEGKVLTWNPGAERVLGYREEEILGQSSFVFFTPEDRRSGIPEKELQSAIREGRASDDRWHARKNGVRLWVSGVMILLKDEVGRPRACAKVMRDFTEAKLAEEARRESEERLRVALLAAQMGTWLWRIPTDEQILDDSLRRMMGLPPGEEVKTLEGFLRSVHSEDRARVRGEFERCSHEGGDFSVEFRVIWSDGSERWLKDRGKAFPGPDGRPILVTGACVDITDRKKSEEALARDAQILAGVSDSVIVTDLNGIITYWNEGATRLFGWKAEEMLGRHYSDRFPEPARAWIAEQIQSRAAGTEWAGEFEDWRKDGSRVWIDARVGPVHDASGRPVAILGLAHDLTERKGMEEALREADQRKDEFLAMLGHELRNPLAPLRTVTETLRRQNLDDAALARAYAMMDRQVLHLTRLVDDLLDVSRITRGLVELRKEPVNLAQVADQAIEMVTPALEGRGHELSVTLAHKPIQVKGDSTRLTQIIFNLLNNAAKYTDPGGRIWLTVEREGDQAVVRVRDNGSGMPPDLVPKVFDLFAQGKRSLDRSQGGLGLGLTLVKRLAELHGGHVEAHSAGLGQGSEFVVFLPVLQTETTPSSPPKRSIGTAKNVQVDRALVVDDNTDVAESILMLLEGLARDVRMVHSGSQALEIAPEFKPDLVLCDIGMPAMDGYEVARRLRQLPGFDKVLLAAVSGYGQEQDRNRSKEAGFDRHLVKPIGRATLEEMIKTAANGGVDR